MWNSLMIRMRPPSKLLLYSVHSMGIHPGLRHHLLQVTDPYSSKTMTARWSVVMFFDILYVSAYNMFVVWMELSPCWKRGKFFKRRLLLEELGKVMVAQLIQWHQDLPWIPSSAELVRALQGPEAKSMVTRNRRKKRRGAICVHQEMSK